MEDLLWLLIVGYLFFGDALRKWWRRTQERGRQPERPPWKDRPARADVDADLDPDVDAYVDVGPLVTEADYTEILPAEINLPTPVPAGRAMALRAPTPRASATLPYTGGKAVRGRLGLEDREALRRAIVLTAVLGPCRANESPKPRGEGADLRP